MQTPEGLIGAAKYPHVFSPLRLGPVEVKNRIYFAPHYPVKPRPGPTEEQLAYYVERARGGCGLIFDKMQIHPRGPGSAGTAYLRHTLPNYAAFAQAIHDAGAKVFAQIYYSHVSNRWRYEMGSPVTPVFSPSPIQLFDDFHVTHEMSVEDIKKMIDIHRVTSAHLAEAGYDGVQVHCSHSMLVERFLSPYFNHRTDEWGGSLENRMRFLVECLRAAREAGGPGFSVGMRFNVDEMLSGGIDQDAAREVVERLVDMDLLHHIDMDIAVEPDQFPFGMPPYFMEPGLYESFVRAVRPAAGAVPVLCVLGRVTRIAQAERAIAGGVCDMVGAARGLMAEPDLVKHAAEGREEDSRTCLACNICLFNKHTTAGCAINPSTSREWYWSESALAPAAKRATVVVVGGGPAGMEAARVAAKKGHRVVLFERRDRLGGQMHLWAALPGRDVFATTPVWYEKQLRKLGVDVRTRTVADAAGVLAERPDAVVVATGARYVRTGESGFMAQPIPGHDRPFVYTPEQILKDGVRPSGRVLVLDEEGIHTGAGVAELIAAAGAKVRLVTRWLQPVENMGPFEFAFVIPRLQNLGVELEQMRYVKEIGDGTVTTFNVFTNEERTDPVDAVVLATARRSTTTLGRDLEGQVAQLFLVGDALAPRGLSEAFYEGQRFARYIGEPGAPRSFSEDFFTMPDDWHDPRPASVVVQHAHAVAAL